MPACYKIDSDRKLILITGADHTTPREALNLQEECRKDSEFDPTFAQLLDLAQVKKLDLNSSDVRQIARSLVWLPGVRRAFLADADVAFGLARSFESYRKSANDPGTSVLGELDQALQKVLSESVSAAG